MIYLEKEGNKIEILSQNKLIVGNADSILKFGCEEQRQLREFSRTISDQLLDDNREMEYLIQDILNEINNFQNLIEKKQIFSLESKEKKREKLIKQYNSILVYMDKMELTLKLQEAQLIKDSKLFEKLSGYIESTVTNLQVVIAYGKHTIEQRTSCQISEEVINWYERLSKKVEDLGISYTVAIQTKAQIQLLLENNTELIDRIVGVVSGTIPIWRNQITILLGIERMNRNLEIQNKVAEITQNYITKDKTVIRKEQKELSVEKMLYTNETLKKVLDELGTVEKRDGKIKLELGSSLR